MEERENKREETASDAELQRLVEDFITQKQVLLIQVKKGVQNEALGEPTVRLVVLT